MNAQTAQTVAHIIPNSPFSLKNLANYTHRLQQIPSIQQIEFQPHRNGKLLAKISAQKFRAEGALALHNEKLQGKAQFYLWNLFRHGHHIRFRYEQVTENNQVLDTEFFWATAFQLPIQGIVALTRRQFYQQDLLEFAIESTISSENYRYAAGLQAQIARIDSSQIEKSYNVKTQIGWNRQPISAKIAGFFALPSFQFDRLSGQLKFPNPLFSKQLQHNLQMDGWRKLEQPLFNCFTLGGENIRSLPNAFFYAPQIATFQNDLRLFHNMETSAGLFADAALARTSQSLQKFWGIGLFLSLGNPHWLNFSWGYSIKPSTDSFAETILRIHINREF